MPAKYTSIIHSNHDKCPDFTRTFTKYTEVSTRIHTGGTQGNPFAQIAILLTCWLPSLSACVSLCVTVCVSVCVGLLAGLMLHVWYTYHGQLAWATVAQPWVPSWFSTGQQFTQRRKEKVPRLPQPKVFSISLYSTRLRDGTESLLGFYNWNRSKTYYSWRTRHLLGTCSARYVRLPSDHK